MLKLIKLRSLRECDAILLLCTHNSEKQIDFAFDLREFSN